MTSLLIISGRHYYNIIKHAAVEHGEVDIVSAAWFFKKVRIIKAERLSVLFEGHQGHGSGVVHESANGFGRVNGQGDGPMKRARVSEVDEESAVKRSRAEGDGRSVNSFSAARDPDLRRTLRVRASDVVHYLDVQRTAPFACPAILLRAREPARLPLL